MEQLRIEFRGYIETKVAQELVDFYLDSLDREEVAGFFKRQVWGRCAAPAGPPVSLFLRACLRRLPKSPCRYWNKTKRERVPAQQLGGAPY